VSGENEVEIRCSVHGAMRQRLRPVRFVCPGWDGEGCPAELTFKGIADGQETWTNTSSIPVVVEGDLRSVVLYPGS
jgi:hypothetical protein